MNTAEENDPESAADLSQDVAKIRERITKIKSLETAIQQEQTAYRQELSRSRKRLSELKLGPTQRHSLQSALNSLETSRPGRMPFLLWAALGPANLVLPEREKLAYKTSYERFKVVATITHLTLSLVLLLVFREWPWLDAVSNLHLLYSYSTMTLREHVLRYNGSTMPRWWIWHHYTCVMLAGLLLLWPATRSYYALRGQLLLFMVYIAAVQILQYRYQMSRLYTLRALSRVSPLQMTTDTASVHISRQLVFLLPLLLFGHMLQFHFCHKFVSMALVSESMEWQMMAIGVLFGVIASGNLGTTIYALWRKLLSAKSPTKRTRSESSPMKSSPIPVSASPTSPTPTPPSPLRPRRMLA